VAGLIVAVGGYFIYQSIENYLFHSYKEEKKAFLVSVTKLLDENSFKKLASSASSKSSAHKDLNRKLLEVSKSDLYDNRLFTLAIDPKTEKLKYVTDSYVVNRELILVSNDSFEVQISKDDKGNLGLWDKDKLVNSIAFRRGNRTTTFLLKPDANGSTLEINGTQVLRLSGGSELSAKYKSIILNKQNTSFQSTRITIAREEQTISYRFIKANSSLHVNGNPFFAPTNLTSAIISIAKNNSATAELTLKNESGSSVYIYAPIKKAKQTIGVIVLQIGSSTQKQLQQGLLQPIIFGLSILAVCWMFASIVIARKITNPMEQLTLAIVRLIQQDFNFKLSPKNFGSFGFLANQFNMMLMRLQKSRTELIHLNKSYSRFVPHQLLKQLSAGGVNDISLGDSCEREMTVLFCDIRGFTSLSETMSPSANFRFINRYLSQIAPVINKHSGIIDKYLGDGIMALFPSGADDAVKASIEMLESLDKYNKKLKQNKLPIIEVGLGLHTGNTMLGTVGTSSRMDATVISDTVNAAARVESMTKAFATKILITEETKRALSDLSQYRIRYIASCRIQGKSKPVTLYEIFNNDSLSMQKEKLQNQSMMIQAWKAYKDGDSARAIQMYQRLIEKSPHDKSLFALIERCQSGRL